MPSVVDYSAADRILPEPSGGSNSKEKLQIAIAGDCKQLHNKTGKLRPSPQSL